ncbi:hypothetical protein NBRC116494_19450 [Aurantivibrio plasticivorans]
MQFNQLFKSGIKSRLAKFSLLGAALLCLTTTTGCTSFQFPGVYRLTIQQGNVITQDMVDQLKPGMTPRQVSYILGTPLIADSFQQDRWDYLYTLRDPEGNTKEERFTVFFKNGGLSHFTGDYMPTPNNDATEAS